MVLWWPREILMGFFTSSHCLGKLTEISTSSGVFWMNCVVVSHWLIHSIFGKHNLNTVFSFVWTNGRNDAGCRNVLHLTRWVCLLRNLHEHGFISMLKPFVGRWPCCYNGCVQVLMPLKRMCSPVRLSMTMSYWPTK